MRYEYLILPPRRASILVRLFVAVRALFRHPGRTLMIGLVFLFLATRLSGQGQGGPAPEERARLKARIRDNGYRVIVGLRPSASVRGISAPGRSAVSEAAARGIVRRLEDKGFETRGRLSLIPAVYGRASARELDALLDDPQVEYVEVDEPQPLTVRRVGSAARFAQQTPWGIPRVTAPEAWALGGAGAYGAGVKVAYLDSGGDWNHPDLQYAGGYNPIKRSTSPADWADDVVSCEGHGTHVGGTIAARRNDLGVVGVAPEVQLYAIKVLQDLGGACLAYQSDQIAGLEWAVNNGVRVVSISLGGNNFNASYQNAISSAVAAGVYVVASAGNNGSPTLTYPGNYAGALAIGALDRSNQRSGYSNYGPNLYLSAPGDEILSTIPGGYGVMSGTSMATPHVAGVVALLLARYPGISRAQLLSRLQQGALDLGAAGRDDGTGWGLVRSRESMDGGYTPPPVPIAIAIDPSSRRDSAAAGEAFARPDSALVSLSGTGSGSIGWTAWARKGWTALATPNGVGTSSLRWTRLPAGLGQGLYVDTITVTAAGVSASVIDSLRILAPPPPPGALTLQVSPGSRNHSAREGATSLIIDSAFVLLSGPGAGGAPWGAVRTKSWISLTVSGGSGSGIARWSRNPAGLPAGVHVDTITVLVPNAVSSPSFVVDSLVITAPAGQARRVRRAISSGSGTDQEQAAATDSVLVDVSAGVAWSASTSASWVQLTTGSGTGAAWLRWKRNLHGMGEGISEDSLVVASGVGSDREVRLVVNEIIVVGADLIAPELAAAPFFAGPALSQLQQRMFDLLGNANGVYDVGDFLAYFDRTGRTSGGDLITRVLTRSKSSRP